MRGLGLQGIVRITGYLPPEVFSRYVAAVDVGVNLRNPTWGESSATLVRLMGHGVPSLVTDAGAFAELPGEAVVTVPVGTSLEEAKRLAFAFAPVEEPTPAGEKKKPAKKISIPHLRSRA